jgi:nucleotide-binding universal stress UspA family protein
MFRTILCATDFSPCAEHALEHAVAWATQQQAALQLVHVHAPTPYPLPPGGGAYVRIEREYVAALHESMTERVRRLHERWPRVHGRVIHGPPAWAIVELASAIEADLVVMGTSGHSAVAHALLGSVADRVLRGSRIPLLLVPHGERSVAVPPRKLIVPTDHSEPARSAIRRAAALAGELDASVLAVHAYELPPYLTRDVALADDIRAAIATTSRQELHELGCTPRVEARVLEGPAPATIVTATEDAKADLVVMASTGRNMLSTYLLGGVTNRVVRTSHVPVMVLPKIEQADTVRRQAT